MKLTKIRYSSDECVRRINTICLSNGIEVAQSRKSDHIVLKLSRKEEDPGTVRVYDTKKGRTLDGSLNNTEINDLVLEQFQTEVDDAEDAKIVPKTTIYYLKKGQVNEVGQAIEKLALKNEYKFKEKDDVPSHISYIIEVKHPKYDDKVTITQFKKDDGRKLMLQGRGWEVWDEVCNSIDQLLDMPVEEITIRFMGQTKDVTSIVTSDLTSQGEDAVKERLGNAHSFLYDHDKKLVISSQSMLIAAVDYGDYYCYVAPCLRVIEGYLKKVIVGLGLFTETQIQAVDTNGKPTFHFGLIFNGLHNVIPTMKARLSADPNEQNKKETALLLIYTQYQKTRNPLQHDGPPVQMTVDSYDDAESHIDEILGMIRHTYHEIFN